MKFDLLIHSAIVKSDKPNKGLEAQMAANPNQMNRLIGFLPDGTRVVIAQRHGKGGMDFNKLVGGKVFAVAADGLSPVYEKDKDGKATKVQKQENGLPLYSSSGFYSMSSKEYPALELGYFVTRLINKGEHVLLVNDQQLAGAETYPFYAEEDLELLDALVPELLSDTLNFFSRFDADINKKRQRLLSRAQEDAEANNEDFTGVAFKPLTVSKKDGKPFVLLVWRDAQGNEGQSWVLRQGDGLNDNRHAITEYYDAQEAWDQFRGSEGYAALVQAIADTGHIDVAVVQGHLCRTSVSFRRKAENVFAAPAEKQAYGDAVYIKGALSGWTPALVTFLHSMHPNFPQADYDAHHYVAAPRQALLGMNKQGERWSAPQTVMLNLHDRVLKAGVAA